MKRSVLTVLLATTLIAACKDVKKEYRARILDKTAIVPLYISIDSCKVYRIQDTVWENLSTYQIDNVDSTAMQVVIEDIVF